MHRPSHKRYTFFVSPTPLLGFGMGTDKHTESDGSERMEKETLQEVRSLRGEVAQINRSQADLQTDQAAMLRDIHHMNLQMVDQAQSIKEMANAVVKLAAVSEKMDRANKDINELGEKTRSIEHSVAEVKDTAAKDKAELKDLIHVLENNQKTLSARIDSNDKSINYGRWFVGSIALLLIGNILKMLTGL